MSAGGPEFNAVEFRLDGPTAMARDIALLERGEFAFRVYTWEDVWVTLGRNQKPEDALVEPGLTPWIRRPTGGAAVLHGHDVTVGLVLPLQFRSTESTYRAATRPLVLALHAVGIDAALAADVGEQSTHPQFADCFASTSRNDIVFRSTRKKVCGCALYRTREMVLLQASIPAAEPSVAPSSVIRNAVASTPVAVDAEGLRRALATQPEFSGSR